MPSLAQHPITQGTQPHPRALSLQGPSQPVQSLEGLTIPQSRLRHSTETANRKGQPPLLELLREPRAQRPQGSYRQSWLRSPPEAQAAGAPRSRPEAHSQMALAPVLAHFPSSPQEACRASPRSPPASKGAHSLSQGAATPDSIQPAWAPPATGVCPIQLCPPPDLPNNMTGLWSWPSALLRPH